jgi:RNA polymerase sigma-70 factor (ECF subfamily)
MTDTLEPPDEHLVSLSKNGSLDAFNSLVDRYQSLVFTLCYRLIGERTAAEDAAQETFIAAYRGISHFKGGNFRAWLLRIATNQARDELRRRQRRLHAHSLVRDDDQDDIDPPDPVADPASTLDDRTLAPVIELALQALPLDQRQVLLLADVLGFQYEEIVTITGASMGTVKSRLFRARERMRATLSRHPELFPRSGRFQHLEEP